MGRGREEGKKEDGGKEEWRRNTEKELKECE